MLTLTASAIKAVRRFVEGSSLPQDAGLRIQVSGGGCSGLQYGLKLETASAGDDTIIENEGVKIFIDPESLPKIQGMTVDFVDSLEGSGFKFTNPNAKASCSCGNSFSA